jgi:hypothetical protein
MELFYSCRTGPSGYIGLRAGTTTLSHSQLYAPSQGHITWASEGGPHLKEPGSGDKYLF